jgi:hypothetical protein
LATWLTFFWVAELFWQSSAEAELGRTSQIRPNPNFGTELRRISNDEGFWGVVSLS